MHHPLNYWHLSHTEQEDVTFYAELAIQNLDPFKTKPLHDPVYHALLQQSWERIFDLDVPGDSAWRNNAPRAAKRIQGTFWKLSCDQVRKVTYFTARNNKKFHKSIMLSETV
jgi:hypothetical protein